MKKHLSFQSKLAITYSLFLVILMLIMGLGFYHYNAYLFEKNALTRINELAVKTSQQLDNHVQPMDYISKDLISREELINSLRDLMSSDRDNSQFSRYVREANSTVKNLAMRTLVTKEGMYTVNLFNTKGDFFTNSKIVKDNDVLAKEIYSLDWIKIARAKDGDKYIVPPSQGVWSTGSSATIFSLVRMIRDPGREIGFIEIQNSVDTLSTICTVGVDKNIKVLLINDSNEVIYSAEKLKQESLNYYASLSRSGSFNKNPFTGTLELINRVHSDYTGWTLILIEDKKSILQPLGVLKKMTMIIGAGLTAITFIFFYFFSKQLTKPLRKLKKTMEEMQIENLPKPMVIHHENDEITALNRSFQEMRLRLSDAINHEFKLRSLQLRAHFDSLQAQINPHFMHNMLNVLANMGLEAGAGEVANTCRRISAMLRYSTSTDKRRTTIKDELEHADNYLLLMKMRFEHKLEFRMNMDRSMMDIEIPKIVLQPLVENSISHGFEDHLGTMIILIKGFTTENEWQIDIIDNGSGFSEDILKDLESRIENYANQILNNEDAMGLSIGGMGIISTFARLRLFYGSELKFVLKNNDTHGACISIGGSLDKLDTGGESIV